MIVTIIQSCIYIKHEVCRNINPEIGADAYSVFHSNLYNICDGLGKTSEYIRILMSISFPYG